jgi:hypothetical protein
MDIPVSQGSGRGIKYRTTYNKDELYSCYEKLGTHFLKNIPFDAVALGVMEVDSKLSTGEEQGTEE